jgi:hypothetical protein
MKIYITEENFNIKNHTHSEVNETFINHIYVHLKKYDVKEIVTNSHIAYLFSEHKSFVSSNITTTVVITPSMNEPYSYGVIKNEIKIYVDPYMRWMDDKIIPRYDLSVIRRNKLHKILNKEYKDYLEEIVIDKKIGDMLI